MICLLHIFSAMYNLSSHFLDSVFGRREVFTFNDIQPVNDSFMYCTFHDVSKKSLPPRFSILSFRNMGAGPYSELLNEAKISHREGRKCFTHSVGVR